MSTTSTSTVSTLTTVVNVFVTYCATTTTFTINGVCYSATTPGQYITVTNCPCTVQSVSLCPPYVWLIKVNKCNIFSLLSNSKCIQVCTTPYQAGGTAIITAALVTPVVVVPAVASVAPVAVTPAVQPATSKYVTVSGAPQMMAFMTSFLALIPLFFALIL